MKASCTSGVASKLASVRVERYEINRRIGALKNQIQSRRLIFEHTLHAESFYAPLLCRQALPVACAVPSACLMFIKGTLRWGQRTLQHSIDKSA